MSPNDDEHVEVRVRPKSARSERSRCMRVVIVDDHPVMRAGLTDVLNSEPGIVVIGSLGCAAEACALVARARPDIVVLDLGLGRDDGMELARLWLQARPELRILVLSMHDAALFADRLLALGVMAFVSKSSSREEFLRALRATVRGDVYITDDQRARIELCTRSEQPGDPDELLSSREIAVLRLLAAGKTTAAIAAALAVAPKTVYSHRRNIGAKLGISSGREMLRYAMQWFRSAA